MSLLNLYLDFTLSKYHIILKKFNTTLTTQIPKIFKKLQSIHSKFLSSYIIIKTNIYLQMCQYIYIIKCQKIKENKNSLKKMT